MSRVIKFRAWDKDAKEMLTWNELLHADWSAIYSILTEEPFVPLQFTGLKDRNDIEIYEGDIVACDSNGINREKRVICYDSFQTKYKAVPLSAYHLNAGNGGWTGYELKYHNEVIGNIYENIELLKDGESHE